MCRALPGASRELGAEALTIPCSRDVLGAPGSRELGVGALTIPCSRGVPRAAGSCREAPGSSGRRHSPSLALGMCRALPGARREAKTHIRPTSGPLQIHPRPTSRNGSENGATTQEPEPNGPRTQRDHTKWPTSNNYPDRKQKQRQHRSWELQKSAKDQQPTLQIPLRVPQQSKSKGGSLKIWNSQGHTPRANPSQPQLIKVPSGPGPND